MMNLQNLVLRPNCLLTPSALVFVPGPRSLFYFKNPFAKLPLFLHEHGYRTQLISLPFRNHHQRELAFTNWFTSKHDEKFHLVMAQNTYAEFKNRIPANRTASVTVLTAQTYNSPKAHPANFFKFVIPYSFLNYLTMPFSYRAHLLITALHLSKATPYRLTFSNANQTLHERFLDHCIKLAENELYA